MASKRKTWNVCTVLICFGAFVADDVVVELAVIEDVVLILLSLMSLLFCSHSPLLPLTITDVFSFSRSLLSASLAVILASANSI